MRDSADSGCAPRLSWGKAVQKACVLAFATCLRALPFKRGKERLTRHIPLDRLASSGCFQGHVFRGKRGILWDASTLPDIMTRCMLWDGSYQDDVLACFSTAIRPGDTVFDIGAHFGLMSIVASKLVGREGKVVAFEPNPRNREVLNCHLTLNLCSNVTVEATGLLDRPGEFEFYMTIGNSWNSTFDASFAETQRYEKITARADTLDNYVARTGLRPVLLKIDTEGTEYECLLGGRSTLRDLRPAIVIEYNPLSQARPGEDERRLLYFLREHGYRMFGPGISFWRNVTGRFNEVRGEGTNFDSLVNVLCVHESDMGLISTIESLRVA